MRNHPILISCVAIAGVIAACSSSKSDSNGAAGAAGSGTAGSATNSGGTAGSATNSGGSAGTSTGSGGEAGDVGSGGTSGSGTAGSSGTGGAVQPGAPGWTAVALLDDMTDPQNTIVRSGNDLVSGIYFASLDDGWVTTRGSQGSFGNGGAVYKAKSTSLTSILFSANQTVPCLGGNMDFMGIDKSPDGYNILGIACNIVASHDAGKTFAVVANDAASFGIEQTLAMRSFSGGTMMFADTGYVATSTDAPGPTSTWTTIWAPEASPSVPMPVPTDECQTIQKNAQPAERTVAYVSPDAKLVAYVTATGAQEPIVCVSKDSGKSFFPRSLPNFPTDATDFAPSGVVFASSAVGITWWADNIYPAGSYIYRTTDSGDTWTSVALPTAVAGKAIELTSGFFAPDGTNGWLVGYDYDASSALILRTVDAGVTWTKSGGDLATKVDGAGGGKLYTGFALDAYHIWVGGDYGVLMANADGGD
jgi:hypothetical protein